MKEQISAFVDGEFTAEEGDSVIEHLTSDENAKRAWGRYHLIGEVMRSADSQSQSENTVSSSADVVQLPPRGGSRLTSPLAGLAIAASVAVLAVMFILRADTNPTTPAIAIAEQTSAPATQDIERLNPALDTLVVPPQQDRRLEGYLVNFNEQRSRHGVPGVHPYVRIVGFDTQ